MHSGSYLTRIFGQSPIRPLEMHMENVLTCVRELKPFMAALRADDVQTMETIYQRIVELEREADDKKHDLRLHIPHNLFMPVSRRDVLDTLKMQDRLADSARDIAGLIYGRRMRLPEAIATPFFGFLDTCVDACEQANVAIQELDELVETGFSMKMIEVVEGLLRDLGEIEQRTDEQKHRISAQIMELESTMNPIEVMFLYKLLDQVASMADRAEKVGARLQLMLAR